MFILEANFTLVICLSKDRVVYVVCICRYDKPVKGRKINWMKAGILESNRVLTVSPYYAQELLSGIERGVELESYLRMTSITGIVNGMDTNEWNPVTDEYIAVNYDATTVRTSHHSVLLKS